MNANAKRVKKKKEETFVTLNKKFTHRFFLSLSLLSIVGIWQMCLSKRWIRTDFNQFLRIDPNNKWATFWFCQTKVCKWVSFRNILIQISPIHCAIGFLKVFEKLQSAYFGCLISYLLFFQPFFVGCSVDVAVLWCCENFIVVSFERAG